MTELNTRLDTLIAIHNRMHDQAISLELDILLFDEDKADKTATPDQVAYLDSIIAQKADKIETYRDYVRLAGQLIKEELEKQSISSNN